MNIPHIHCLGASCSTHLQHLQVLHLLWLNTLFSFSFHGSRDTCKLLRWNSWNGLPFSLQYSLVCSNGIIRGGLPLRPMWERILIWSDYYLSFTVPYNTQQTTSAQWQVIPAQRLKWQSASEPRSEKQLDNPCVICLPVCILFSSDLVYSYWIVSIFGKKWNILCTQFIPLLIDH